MAKKEIGYLASRAQRLLLAYGEFCLVLKDLQDELTPQTQCHILMWVSFQLYPKMTTPTRKALVYRCWEIVTATRVSDTTISQIGSAH
jgi:hypothetical protein